MDFPLSLADFDKLNVFQMRQILRERGLDSVGTITLLRERFRAHGLVQPSGVPPLPPEPEPEPEPEPMPTVVWMDDEPEEPKARVSPEIAGAFGLGGMPGVSVVPALDPVPEPDLDDDDDDVLGLPKMPGLRVGNPTEPEPHRQMDVLVQGLTVGQRALLVGVCTLGAGAYRKADVRALAEHWAGPLGQGDLLVGETPTPQVVAVSQHLAGVLGVQPAALPAPELSSIQMSVLLTCASQGNHDGLPPRTIGALQRAGYLDEAGVVTEAGNAAIGNFPPGVPMAEVRARKARRIQVAKAAALAEQTDRAKAAAPDPAIRAAGMVKRCPKCGVQCAEEAIGEVFGFRVMRPGGKPIPQSQCHTCRRAASIASDKSRKELARLVAEMDQEEATWRKLAGFRPPTDPAWWVQALRVLREAGLVGPEEQG